MLKSFKWRLPEAWLWAILVWLIARLALTLIGVLLSGLHVVPANSPYGNLYFEITPLRDGWSGALLGVWQRWDAIHYLRIASFGYGGEGLLAFFPLYPALARLLSFVLGGNILLSMLVISNVATIVAFATLYRLTQDFFSTALARLAVIALAVYPAAIYLYAPYAEPLAVCLVLVTYLAARQMRRKTALLAGIAAGLSQPIAAPAVVLIGWEVWQRRQIRLMPLAAVLGPALGVGAYFLWSAQHLGQSYISVQNSWGRNFQWPWQNAVDIVQMFRSGTVLIGGWAELLALGLAIAAAVWSFRHLPRSAALYQLATLAMFLIVPWEGHALDSFARHTLIMFPLFMALASWYDQTRRPVWCVTVSSVLFIYLSIYFFLWQ